MADDSFAIEKTNISKLKVSDLKRELKARGLNASGNKNELIERLTEAIDTGKNDDGSADSADELIDDDDVLNDDEIEEEVDDLKLDVIETEAPSTPNISKTTKRKLITTNSSTNDNKTSAKKIVLNRSLSTENPIIDVDVTNGNTDPKRVVKLSELSAKERLEMRAKKFGTPLSADAKKEARAERFGQTGTPNSNNTKSVITLNNIKSATPNLDTLKKRAERFGAVSKHLITVEAQEKLEKRKERFGMETNNSNNDDQKAKRLERFKTSLK